jgi:assimilatory nitrate reductase electron transfer subunit
MGDVDADEFSEDAEVVQFVDAARGTFKKLVIRDDRLVGAILLGENATVGTVTQLFDRGTPVPADRRSLMFVNVTDSTIADSPAKLPDRVTICQCNSVTKGKITQCWLGGARSLAGIVERTRATTGCGTCRDSVAGIVEWLAASDPDQAGGTDDPADQAVGSPAPAAAVPAQLTGPERAPTPV